MNLLILTGKFGMGHLSAAEALEQEVLAKDATANVYVIDFIDYMFPGINKVIYGNFRFLVKKWPALYNFFDYAVGGYNSIPVKNIVTNKLSKLIIKKDIDIIFSTLPICSKYVSIYKKKVKDKIPLYTFITDISAHEEWIAPETDIYFVADNTTKQELIVKGIDPLKIKIFGIPVKNEFKKQQYSHINKKDILIMGGGLGLISNIYDILTALKDDSNTNITVITGKNVRLRQKLLTKYPNITVLGYTKDVAKYMNKADLIISKAGGVTLFESIYSKTPLYVIKPFLVQEVDNAKYIEKNNIGRVSWSKKNNFSKDILELLNDEKELNKMKNNMFKIEQQLENNIFPGEVK